MARRARLCDLRLAAANLRLAATGGPLDDRVRLVAQAREILAGGCLPGPVIARCYDEVVTLYAVTAPAVRAAVEHALAPLPDEDR